MSDHSISIVLRHIQLILTDENKCNKKFWSEFVSLDIVKPTLSDCVLSIKKWLCNFQGSNTCDDRLLTVCLLI